MKSNSSSLHAKHQHMLSRFQPYQPGRHELLSSPHLTHSKVKTWDTSSSTTKKYAAQLEANLSNQIEAGLSEAIDFTLNIIEQPLAETHLLDSHITMSAAVYSDSPSKPMPGTWKQSQSPL
ncbi:hypothetical protein EDC04DRAFT_2908364 [Pisolithus marmoratus]|nr:hypothetical protein EDC04DRAFT_2908364 [Pisolithus marmoratus]